MGSATMLDILSSMMISGLLLLSALSMNERATSNTFQSEASLSVQENITSIVENLEWDFRLIGYCKNDTIPSNSFILSGDTNQITFQADINNDGSMDTVTWELEPWKIAGCPNPNVRMLVRKVVGINGVSEVDSSNLGVTQFRLRYFNQIGDTVQTPFGQKAGVQVVEVTVTVQPVNAYADTANKQIFSTWRQTRLLSKNLNNR